MNTQIETKKGDRIGIRSLSTGKAVRVTTVSDVTKDCIVVKRSAGLATAAYDINTLVGMGKWNNGAILDLDWESCKRELDAVTALHDEAIRQRDIIRATPEYKLAETFINHSEPEQSAAAFAKLTMEQLNTIKGWLNL